MTDHRRSASVPSDTPRSDALLAEMKTLFPVMMDLSLGRIERLLAALGHPERRLPPVVHVAGTNGKGSTTAFLRAMAEAAGLRAHVYTSPHLVRFHERIAVAGEGAATRPISEEALVDVLTRVRDVNAGAPITFFEITTAAAFLAFAERPADVVLLEVGLGGEFDTTNVVERPRLCLITPVSMDHVEKLGGTLAKIAAAKAGILKRDVPAVIGPQEPEALDVIRAKARTLSAPLTVWGEDFDAFAQNGRLVWQTEYELLDLPLPGLVGRHQIINAGTAVAAAVELKPVLGWTDDAIGEGLARARWPARMQRLSNGPLADRAGSRVELWLDGGHNPAGGSAIAQTLADLDEQRPMPVVMIAGMMGLKDAAGFLTPFRGLVRQVLTVPIPGAHERPHEPDALADIARRLGLDAEPASSVGEALDRIAASIDRPTRVLITGSLYLAGHVLALQEATRVSSP
jgi:dihydrofolate synthase/folylpolyglutamate synthase